MLKKANVDAVISGKEEDIAGAGKILLPGMGHFDNCMERLNASGLRNIIEKKALEEKIPVLGICVGLQMFMEGSEEGVQPGLGWVKGKTIRFNADRMKEAYKIPNMGWLEIQSLKPSPLLEGLDGARFYFAHSYHVETADTSTPLIAADYGYRFTAAVEQDNLVGVQFHPEKSHRFGMKLLANFALNY